MLQQFLGLLYAFIVSDTIAAALGAWALWGLRKTVPPAKYVGIVLSAIAFDQICQVIANFESPLRHAHINLWFFCWWIAGRTMRSAAMWSLALYLFGIHRRSPMTTNRLDPDPNDPPQNPPVPPGGDPPPPQNP